MIDARMRGLLMVALALPIVRSHAGAQESALWGDLTPGPHVVGFRSPSAISVISLIL
jgi:hypothetical protein